MNRRDFLGTSLAAAVSLGASKPHWRFPTEPRKRLAVSSYPFRSVMQKIHAGGGEGSADGMTLEQFAATIAPKLGVPGIEPWSRHFKSTDPDYLRGLKSAFQKAGLHVVNIPVDIRVTLCGSATEREAGLADYHKWVDAAAMLGSPSIRVHLPHGEKGGDNSCAVESLKALAAYGESKSIVINVENDNPDTEQPERIVEVLKAVNSPFLRSLPDFCNSMAIHDDEQYNEKALSTLFPLAYNISHVKDLEQDENKVYRVNVERIFAVAKRAHYAGYFSMEWEGRGDPYEGTGKLIEASLKSLAVRS
ncbi:MAG TPA: sugar phosphate isomerase/epimerase family protein [Bryobacteraceae bacterium]|nr:sugar phosphate isomerase/epimerase family protein [Bryobacteraceae bacterium]